MAVFGYTCKLITQLKPKQQEIETHSIMQTFILFDCDSPVNMIYMYYKYLPKI